MFLNNKIAKNFIVLVVLLSLMLENFAGLFFINTAHASIQSVTKVALKKGWNMFTTPDKLYDISKSSGCKITSGPWIYDGIGYQQINQLAPLIGAWIKVDNDCDLNLNNPTDTSNRRLGLHAGWNMIGSIAGKSWEGIKSDCVLTEDSPILWHWNGSKYEQIDINQKMQKSQGYWVKVKKKCIIDDSVKTIVPPNDTLNQCYQKYGAPINVCSPSEVSGSSTNPICNYNSPTCVKNSDGSVQWQCKDKSDPLPPNLPAGCQPNCTQAGWEQVSCSTNNSNFQINVCNFVPSLIGSVIGNVVGNLILNDKTIASIVGNNVIKLVQTILDFYFWLKSHNIDPQTLASNSSQFNEVLNEFLNLGSNILQNIAVDQVKALIIQFGQQLKIDPQLIIELANFFQYVIKTKGSIDIILSLNEQQIEQLIFDYVSSSSSPLLRQLHKLNEIVNLIQQSMNSDINLATNISKLLDWLVKQKGISIDAILNLNVSTLGNYLIEFNSQNAGFLISIDSATLKNYISLIINNLLKQYNIDIDLYLEINGFIQFLVNNGSSLDDILKGDANVLKNKLIEFIQKAPGGDKILSLAIDIIIKQAVTKLSQITGVNPDILAAVGRLLEYLLQGKKLDINAVVSISSDQLTKLVAEFISQNASQIVGIPIDTIRTILQVLISTNLISQIPHFDISKSFDCKIKTAGTYGLTCSIFGINIVDVSIGTTFSCPIDLITAACQILDPGNWRVPSIENFDVSDDNPNDLKVSFKWAGFSHPGQFKVCTLPNINISLLGNNLVSGLNFKLGPVQIDGPGLWLDMPTSCSLKTGEPRVYDGIDTMIAASFDTLKKGVDHIYLSAGNYNPETSCKISFDPFDWSKNKSQKNVAITNSENWKASQITLNEYDKVLGGDKCIATGSCFKYFNITQAAKAFWEWAINDKTQWGACDYRGFKISDNQNYIVDAGIFPENRAFKPAATTPLYEGGNFDGKPQQYFMRMQTCYPAFGRVMYK